MYISRCIINISRGWFFIYISFFLCWGSLAHVTYSPVFRFLQTTPKNNIYLTVSYFIPSYPTLSIFIYFHDSAQLNSQRNEKSCMGGKKYPGYKGYQMYVKIKIMFFYKKIYYGNMIIFFNVADNKKCDSHILFFGRVFFIYIFIL